MNVSSARSLSLHGAPPPSTYAYRAVDTAGTMTAGSLEAASREAAAAEIAARGLFALELMVRDRPVEQRRALGAQDLALGLRALANLLAARLPLTRVLTAFAEIAPVAWRPALPSLQSAVREGHPLTTALANAPVPVPALVIGIVQAGEAAGDLAGGMRRAAELTEATARTQEAVRSALAYPLVLAVAGMGSLGLLVGMVLPRFAAILADLGQTLPPSTRFVLAVGAHAKAGLVVACAVTIGGALAWRAWTSTPMGRTQWHSALLAVPLIGPARRAAATARVAAALAALLDAGVPVAGALLHAARAAGDAAIGARLAAAREAIVTGARIAVALERAEAMTPTAVALVRTGEETGALSAMLDHAAAIEREQVDQLVKRAVRVLEPVLILVFGGVVAFVAAALLQAVYSLRPA